MAGILASAAAIASKIAETASEIGSAAKSACSGPESGSFFSGAKGEGVGSSARSLEGKSCDLPDFGERTHIGCDLPTFDEGDDPSSASDAENADCDESVSTSPACPDNVEQRISEPLESIPQKEVPTQELRNESDGKISYEIHTRNEGLNGDRHPVTGVPFEKKTVEDADGNEVTGVFPEFESKFDAQLPEGKLQASDSEQFAECNDQLKTAVEDDPELAKQFTPEQLDQIKNGDTSDGYTWHHSEEKGKMQLVDSEAHAQTGHTGGRSIWGGGSENR